MNEPQIKIKHTTGPWVACNGDALRLVQIETTNRKGQANDLLPIASLRGPDRVANAKIIAAAPEMFDFIMMVANTVNIPDESASKLLQDLSDEAMSLVKKATGFKENA